MLTFDQFVTEDHATEEQLAHKRGEGNFSSLEKSNPRLHKAISMFKHDPDRHDYCGDCADALRGHLHTHGLKDFESHHHGHSFVGNGEYVVDTWNGKPKVWRRDDPSLKGTVHATEGHPHSHYAHGHSCWCRNREFNSQRIGGG